jgi:hypothetical protein
MPMKQVTDLVVLEPDTKDEYCWWITREVVDWSATELHEEFPHMKDYVVDAISKLEKKLDFFPYYPKCIYKHDQDIHQKYREEWFADNKNKQLATRYHDKDNEILRKYLLHSFREDIEHTIRKYKFYVQLFNLSVGQISAYEKSRMNFQRRIELAKQYPIENLIDILPGDKAYCPYHDENTPSVKIYRKQNTGWAYCCQKYVGPIDIVMEKTNCGFKEAVIRLT